jgi:hypothetical protein
MDDLFLLITGGGIIFTILMVIVSLICTIVPFVAIGGGLFWYIKRSSDQSKALNQAAQMWPSTNGQIVKSRVEVSGGDHTSVSPRIEYTYEVNGVAYQSGNIKAGAPVVIVNPSQSAYDTVDRYPVGAAVTVYYNPANPAQSALER